MQRLSVADRGQSEKTGLALLAQPLERRHHLLEHLRDTERLAAAILCDRIMQVEDVDPLAPQPREARFERLRYGVGDAAERGARQPDFCADDRARGFEGLQDAAEILFRLAVAVLHRGVEIIDPDGKRARDGTLLVARIAAHHQSADRAAAKTQHRELHAGTAIDPHFHCHSSTPSRLRQWLPINSRPPCREDRSRRYARSLRSRFRRRVAAGGSPHRRYHRSAARRPCCGLLLRSVRPHR
jgi:hypothetical protein